MKGFGNSALRADDTTAFCRRIEVPEQFQALITKFVSQDEIRFAADMPEDTFAAADMDTEFIRREYHRGFISKTDETGERYTLNNFYDMLDVFVVSRKNEYDQFPNHERKALDDWYFHAYCDRLNSQRSEVPTQDRVLPLKEVLQFIDRQGERAVYLNYCDCRSLAGACGLPLETCITYRNGINTLADRGLSRRIDKEEAKDIVREADKRGLIHTCNPGGICNCCGDCCYLFRGQQERKSYGVWPATENIAILNADKCVGCGLCAKRCALEVFRSNGKGFAVDADTGRCAGCGLCVNTCPTQALELIKRS
jgi:Pyruvate/2-oxoacid:ferredoxin oxidoreductase delta subunit